MGVIDDLISQIEKLTPSDKARLVDAILRDMVSSDPEIDKVWAKEASIRWNNYKQGKVKSIPYDEVMSKYKGS